MDGYRICDEAGTEEGFLTLVEPDLSRRIECVRCLSSGEVGHGVTQGKAPLAHILGLVAHAFQLSIKLFLQIVDRVPQLRILFQRGRGQRCLVEFVSQFLEHAGDHQCEILFGLARFSIARSPYAERVNFTCTGMTTSDKTRFLPDFRSGCSNWANKLLLLSKRVTVANKTRHFITIPQDAGLGSSAGEGRDACFSRLSMCNLICR